MGGVGSISRSLGQIFDKSCLHYSLEVTFLAQSSSNFLRMIVLMMCRTSSIMGGVRSKSRSLVQIFEKSVYILEVTFSAQSSSIYMKN